MARGCARPCRSPCTPAPRKPGGLAAGRGSAARLCPAARKARQQPDTRAPAKISAELSARCSKRSQAFEGHDCPLAASSSLAVEARAALSGQQCRSCARAATSGPGGAATRQGPKTSREAGLAGRPSGWARRVGQAGGPRRCGQAARPSLQGSSGPGRCQRPVQEGWATCPPAPFAPLHAAPFGIAKKLWITWVGRHGSPARQALVTPAG
jgi:hypothetical protein